MKLRMKRLLTILLVCVLVGTITIPSFATKIEDAQKVKSTLEQKKKQTEAKIESLEKEKGNITVYIQKLDKELNSLKAEIDELSNQIATTETELATAKIELEQAKETEANQYLTMKKRIKYMYENGNQDYIEVLLKAKDVSDLLNRAEYVEKISEYDSNMLVRYQEAKQAVLDKQTEIKTKLSSLSDMSEKVQYEQDTASKLMDDKKVELAKYNKNIDESEQLVDSYDADIDAQENVIENLLEQARKAEEARIAREKKAEEARKAAEASKNNNSNSNNNSGESENSGTDSNNHASSGNFIWPVPSSGRITSYFGNREQPTAGASTNHKGIDIGANTGAEIVASASGSVVVAGYSSSAGNYIMISHGDGIYTVYMHCSKLLVSVGDNVSQGSTIGLVGSTGNSTGPHLHFGVSVNGVYQNPLNYVG